MASNPLIAQGTLNRIRGSVVVSNAPELNVTAPFLGKEGIGLTLEGETTLFIPTMTGAVTSEEPYQMVTIMIHLLKTQSLADQYRQRILAGSNIGDVVVRGDASAHGDYPVTNCAIESVDPLTFNGQDAGFGVKIKGYYNINNDLWNLV